MHDLNPFGRMSSAETMKQLHELYGFTVFPRSIADINLEKGADFESGRFGDVAIDKLTIYQNGLMVDTRSSTEDSEAVCLNVLEEARKRLAATVVITRRHFVNQFSFRSDMDLARLNPVLAKIADRVSKELRSDLRQEFSVDLSAVKIAVDLSQVRVSPGLFSIERRENVQYSEKTYIFKRSTAIGAS